VFSAAAGQKNGRSNRNETLKKRITNIEVRYSIIIIFEKRQSAAIQHFIIRNFLFDIPLGLSSSQAAVRCPNYVKFHKKCRDLAPRFPDTRNLTPET
jgi:hypothetical protein